MRFAAENAVADVVEMRYLNIVEKDYVFKLGRVADHAVIADKRAAADKGAMPYLGIFTDNARRAIYADGAIFALL